MKKKLFISSVLLLTLAMGGLLKYTDIFVMDTGNELTSIGVKKTHAWYSSFQYRKSIVLDEALITGSTTLTNFPVLISITDSSLRSTANGGRVTNNGNDIVFTSQFDSKLDHEIESYNASTGELVAWVKIPSLSATSDTTLYIYFGWPGSISSQENVAGVWSSSYKGVWHMNDGANATIADSTSYTNTFTKKATTEPASATGKIAGGQNWDGVNDYASMADNANISPTSASNTFSAWMYINGFPAASPYFMQLLGDDSSANTPSAIWRFGASNLSGNNKRIGINYNDGSNHDNASGTDASTGAWTYFVVTTDGTNVRYYINGSLVATNAYTYIPRSVSQTWYMGAYGTTARFTKAIMDEMRIYYGAAVSADWVQAEYANQNNPGVGAGKFIQSMGSEEPAVVVPTLASPPSKSNESYTTVTLGGNITSNGGGNLLKRGVCYSLTLTNNSPQHGGSGVTCSDEGNTATGVFSMGISNLQMEKQYSFKAFAQNSAGYGYSSASTFNTLTNLPSGATADVPTGVNSYYVTLVGSANPNSFTNTKGHFRYYTSPPANCNSDTGGTRMPYQSDGSQDVAIPANSSTTEFSYTIPLNGQIFLDPQTNYYYCGFVKNDNGTVGSSNVRSFTTPDGPASPCDPPTSGNITIPATATCTFNGNFAGVDAGTGTTNTASLTVQAGSELVVGASQRIGRGSLLMQAGGNISLAQGAVIVKGGIYVEDGDGDSFVDSQNQYVGSTPPEGYQRRNTVSANYNYAWKITSGAVAADCDGTNQYVYQTVASLVTDADNDGYKTAAGAGSQCVGTSSTINGRTYYKDTSNNSSWLPSASALSGGATDCTDSSAAPCPVSISAGGVTQTTTSLTWSAATGPAPTSYNLFWCSGSSCTPSTQISSVNSAYSHTGRTCNTIYGYKIVAVNAAGNSTDSNTNYQTTSACASLPTVTSPTSSSVTSSGATLGANVTSDGGGAISSRGTCWGTTASPTGNCLATSGTTGVFTHGRTGMPSDTLIYYRGYATNTAGTAYSTDGTFTTSKKSNGEVCSSGSECVSTRCYVDDDNDRYAPSSGTATCRASSQIAGTDCYDDNSNAKPGQTSYYPSDRGDGSYDYDCSGTTTRMYPSTVYLGSGSCGQTQVYNAGGVLGTCSNPTGVFGWCTNFSQATPTQTCGNTFYYTSGAIQQDGSYNSTAGSPCNPGVYYATFATQNCR